jgi:hypothetical protein
MIRSILSDDTSSSQKDITYFIDISAEEGYFFAALHPGKYVARAITPRMMSESSTLKFNIGNKRVYAGDAGPTFNLLFEDDDSVLITFEAFPDKATYIGTIQKIAGGGISTINGWNVMSEVTSANNKFSLIYPNHKEPIEKIADLKPCKIKTHFMRLYTCE